ncbi:hypothetical protein [Mesorhizobium metallidurans]|uniref:hypothetical protein n=1 Tax=Mesorhizobium metallidurans TaxID=489722 RepID=UPI0012F77EFA|nr:hypothetical protein [Mesorhizobium metallidurans]
MSRFQDALPGGSCTRADNRKWSFVFTGATNMLPERRALVAQLVEQRFCNSLDQSAKALES